MDCQRSLLFVAFRGIAMVARQRVQLPGTRVKTRQAPVGAEWWPALWQVQPCDATGSFCVVGWRLPTGEAVIRLVDLSGACRPKAEVEWLEERTATARQPRACCQSCLCRPPCRVDARPRPGGGSPFPSHPGDHCMRLPGQMKAENSRRAPRHPGQQHESSPIDSLRSLLHDAYIASWSKLHRAMPAAVLAPAKKAVHRADELAHGPLKAHDLARVPPLLSVGGHAAPVGISVARFAECAVAGAYRQLLWQLIGDARPLSFEGFPVDKTRLAAAQRAIALICERTERPVAMTISAIGA